MTRNWWFSFILFLIYPLTFLGWSFSAETLVPLTGIPLTVFLAVLGIRAIRQSYFRSHTDTLLHFSMIVDILLEATIIPNHVGFDFLLCWIAFIVVVGGFHAYLLSSTRMHPPTAAQPL